MHMYLGIAVRSKRGCLKNTKETGYIFPNAQNKRLFTLFSSLVDLTPAAAECLPELAHFRHAA
jgi:hypothetical protein